MTEINQEIENMIAEMRVIGQLPAPCRRGNRNNLIKYQDLKCKILERFLSAFESGYRLSVPVGREQMERVWDAEWVDAHKGLSDSKCTQCNSVCQSKQDFVQRAVVP